MARCNYRGGRSVAKLVVVVVVVVVAASMIGGWAMDADPEQDVCVANERSPLYANGFLCKLVVNSSDFMSTLLRNPGPFIRTGAAFQVLDVNSFPALNTQGISMARVDYKPRGLAFPHHHPRASELIVVTKGILHTYFVTTALAPSAPDLPILKGIQPNLRLFHNVLHPGDAAIISRGLVHWSFNPSETEPAQYIAAYNAQNHGFAPTVESLLATSPTDLLSIMYNVSEAEVRRLQEAIGVSSSA